jgi:hypothetical protein
MILRRIIQHVKEQNWTAIAIDFAIVVLGVFVGMQVSNWNAALEDARRGRAYVERLKADLEQNRDAQRALADYYGAVLASVERMDALLADPKADPQELVVQAYRASEINYRGPARATWDEIVSSGDTGLIPREVADSAASYFAVDTARLSLEVLTSSVYRHRVRTIIPLALQKALRAGCSDVRNQTQQITGFMSGCKLEVDAGALTATAAALRADPVVQAELRYQYSDVYSARANIAGDVAEIERALSALAGLESPAETAR